MYLDEFREQCERLKEMGKNAPRAKARPLGSGLAENGETCRTCRHAVRLSHSKAFHKCLLARPHWTSSISTDIRLRDAACSFWEEEREENEENL